MNIYITGYYGYKNFGDELLLLGLLRYISNSYDLQSISVITPDVTWLTHWLATHKIFLQSYNIPLPTCMSSVPLFPKKNSMLFIGGGEVFTDARSFPHNGRNYLFKYPLRLVSGNISFAGGIGSEKKAGTKVLYNICFSLCKQLIVRENFSYNIVSTYTKNVSLHHDFAYDVLPSILKKSIPKKGLTPYVIINCNTHIYSLSVHKKLQTYYDTHNEQGHTVYFFPGTIGFDDSDGVVYEKLKETMPGLVLYDWTVYSLCDICQFVSGAISGYAARLHILLLLKYFSIPFSPLVYQEKVDRLLS